MLKFHMPNAVVMSGKPLDSVLAVLILAQVYAVRMAITVATCSMTVQILQPVKALRPATRNIAFEGTVVGLEMLPAHGQRYLCRLNHLVLDLREFTPPQKILWAYVTWQ